MKNTTVITLLLLLTLFAHAASDDTLTLTVRAGYSFGATAPLGIPATITSIDAFRPTPSVMAGIDLSYSLSQRWALATGLRLENKSMDADITVKGYHMELRKGTESIEGLFTGSVSQQVSQWMLTLPVYSTFRLNSHWQLKAGPYVSILIGKRFSGTASDGYLRQGGPTGPRIDIGNTSNTWATYAFDDNIRRLQMGLVLGADWRPLTRLGFSLDVGMGLTGIFPSDFTTVEQPLYPIYGTLGVLWDIK